MNRCFIRCCLVVLGMGLAVTGAASAETAQRPNIIFIMADDWGYGDVGCYGQKHIRTPHLDRFLATEGTHFTNVYAGASVCAPACSVLMTGQHTGHTRVRGNAGIVGGFQQAARWDNWKAHCKPDGTLELYDLAKDLLEKVNLADRYPDITQRLAAYMKEAHVDSPNWPVQRTGK